MLRFSLLSLIAAFWHKRRKARLNSSLKDSLLPQVPAKDSYRFLAGPCQTFLAQAALQAFVKGGLNVEGKRIVIAGTGPLLLAVAEYLRSKGATIVAIAEQAPSANITRFARGLWGMPSKLAQAAALRAKLIGIPYLTDCWITSAAGEYKLENVTLTRRKKEWIADCDYLACGFHLVPNTELPSLLGCEIENGVVRVDELQQTSRENVFCAGEPTGIGGVEAALIEGKIAGFAATGDHLTAQSLFADRAKTQEFTDKLNKAFALREELKSLADDQTIVCRCEDVEYGRLSEFSQLSRRQAPNTMRNGSLPRTHLRSGDGIFIRVGTGQCSAADLSG